MLVTGLSGAGKTTALKTLEDLGWEAIDNFPIRLLPRLIDTPQATVSQDRNRPIAIGFDTRTRGFDPASILKQVRKVEERGTYAASMLFLDCAGRELQRRYAETRRRHPMAQDRPAAAGIAEERELLQPLRRWADSVIDTTDMPISDLQHEIRRRYALEQSPTSLIITSFGFARGMPPSADLVFDMRFLRNPHWDRALRPLTGQDAAVGAFVMEDPAFVGAIDRITDLLTFLMPRYQAAAKAYVHVAIGCTGGRHRSVFVAEELTKRLQASGFCPTVHHRNLTSRPVDAIEGHPVPPQA
ncbi:RNase adapter RapZ [Blastomonas sp.]|uniref:RNase adapter RapZ n=1 Tax=Blastomonas sp. TaxID=1909299 RepID=UPI003592E9D0